MKSERRHQMQQNELAEVLGSGINTIAPYGRAIVLAIVGIIVIIFAYNFAVMRSRAHDATASLDFLLATSNEDPESFKRVSQDFGDTTPGLWAQQAQADHNLAAGIESMYIDRDEAAGFFDAAIENYKSVIASANDPLLKTRANFGLAKVYEAQGDLDQAIATYEIVAANTNSEVMAEHAGDRIRLLGTEDVREFYAWFRENQPVAAATQPPGMLGLEDLPDAPVQGLPPVQTPDATDGEVMEVPAEPAESTEPAEPPAAADAPAPAESPAAPDSPAPAESETPAEPPAASESETPAAVSEVEKDEEPPSESTEPAEPQNDESPEEKPDS